SLPIQRRTTLIQNRSCTEVLPAMVPAALQRAANYLQYGSPAGDTGILRVDPQLFDAQPWLVLARRTVSIEHAECVGLAAYRFCRDHVSLAVPNLTGVAESNGWWHRELLVSPGFGRARQSYVRTRDR